MKRLAIPILAAAFIAGLFVFLSSQITAGMRSEGTDWALYVTHARNILKGLPYAHSGYVFQPESTTEVGSNAYPSGYPLMLVPFYAAFGMNLRVFKLLNAGFLVLALWPIYLFARRTLSQAYSLVLIVAFGLSTLFLFLADGIGSDPPYELVSFLVLLLLLHIYDRKRNETEPWKWGMLAGVAIAAAYLIRPFGLAFLLAIGGVELLRRRPTRFLAAVAFGFIPLLLLNNFLLYKDTSYARQFTFSIPQIARHAIAYVGFLSYAFANPISHVYRYILWAMTLLLAMAALCKRVRERFGVTELYLVVVLAVISVYWVPNQRYLFCVMPIYLVLIFEGFRMPLSRLPQRFVGLAQVAGAILVLFAPAANAVLSRPDPGDTLVTAPAYEALCAAVRQQTPQDSYLIFWNPRVLAFSTGRHASGWPADGSAEQITTYLRRVHPGYVVADRGRTDDSARLLPVLTKGSLAAVTIWSNDQFSLLKLLDDTGRRP